MALTFAGKRKEGFIRLDDFLPAIGFALVAVGKARNR
jgi:hypothetical protein